MFNFVRSLLIAASIVFIARSATAQEKTIADLAIVNATVLRCNASMATTDAIAVKDGRIIAIGEESVRGAIDLDNTRVIDAGRQCVTPGLTDSHLHFVGLGQSLQMLDLSEASSWSDIVEQVRASAEVTPTGTWIEGRGWHQSKWDQSPPGGVDGYPSHKLLSELVPNHPVLLTHASGHACFANEAAMKLAGISIETPDPRGGEILRDEQNQPIGVFRENAQSLIRGAKSRSEQKLDADASLAMLKEQIRLAGNACLRNGITSVHDAGSSFQLAESLRILAEAGELPVRIAMMIRAGSAELKGRLSAESRIATENNLLSVRSIKVSIDGALGPHGAWLLAPYEDLPTSSGLNTVSIDELRWIAELCKEHQWQLCVHAIGDRANREVLDAYELTLGAAASDDHRWRIEHAQHLSPEDIPRFSQLGVIPAMQANHCTSDAIFVPARIGERRSEEGAYVWRSLIDSGSIIPNGTDAPVEKIDPRVSLYASVTRQLSGGEKFYPEQCMTRKEALLSYTLWPAIAAFQEQDLGSIDIGKRADFAIWDRNLLTCPAEAILKAKLQTTILGGNIVFDTAP